MSLAHVAHVHVQVEEWKGRDEIVSKGETWQSVRKKTEGGKQWIDRCKELCEEFKCMIFFERRNPGTFPKLQVDGQGNQ